MAASTAITLNDLFSSTLTSGDEDALAAIVQDYFRIDINSQEDLPLDDEDLFFEEDDVVDPPEECEDDPIIRTLPAVTSDDLEEASINYGIPVPLEERPEDRKEAELIDEFSKQGCNCLRECSRFFSESDYALFRNHCTELDRESIDMVIMGQLISLTSNPDSQTTYMHKGQKICRTTFLFLHNISRKRLTAIKIYLSKNGLEPRVHGNRHRQPAHALTPADVTRAVQFIGNYAEDHGILLPGRIPGYKRCDLQLLPSNSTKKSVWELYVAATETLPIRVTSYRAFLLIWKKYLPHIVIIKPMSDLCWVCQQNTNKIMRNINRTEEEKSQTLKTAEQHLLAVTKERSYFQTAIKKAKDSVQNHFSRNQSFHPPSPHCCHPPSSTSITVHYSFDFAQQVHYPSDPLQPGPVYFLTPRKCGIFGVCCEAIPRQTNYLIDEAVDAGKGANTVVSMLHHFFANHGLGEEHVHLHADNCVGQNKNNTMIHYLMWRVMKGLHKSIELSFLMVGHTKFSPDACFGLFKKRFRVTKVDSLDDIVKVVVSSAQVNEVQLFGRQSGEIIVQTYDWAGFFGSQIKKIPLITKHHHFKFYSTHPGTVTVKEHSDSHENVYVLTHLRNLIGLPEIVHPRGLSLERQWYLHDKIREFCSPETRDLVCPEPHTPKPRSSSAPPSPQPSQHQLESENDPLPPPIKKRRVCGSCGQFGHNKRTCPQ